MIKDTIKKLKEETENRLEILEINEKFLSRKIIKGEKEAEISLGNVQRDIKNLREYLDFLKEV